MSVLAAELATETRTADCPRCGGAGEICIGPSSVVFDTAQDQWYPVERVYVCDRCEGECSVQETFCLVCAEPTYSCGCTDAQLEAYLLNSYLGAA